MKKISLIKINGRCPYLLFFAIAFMLFTCPHKTLAQEPTADTPGVFFYQANIYYQEAKYEAAIKGYERIIALGLESGNLYYNLGNCYFKKGELGLAVLNYERAKGFIPNDSDLSSNYDYVLHELNLELKPFGNWFERKVYLLFQPITIDLLTSLLCFIYIVLILFLTLGLFFNRVKRLLPAVICVTAVLFILSADALVGRISLFNKAAIVVSKEADVKFEPLENATTYFKLGEGSKVEVVEKAESWCKIRRFDNKLGWVSKDALRQIK